MIGRQLGQYQIIREVGRGGMGIVYCARQLSLNREVALKVLSVDRLVSQDGLERFQREASVIAQVAHPNIVQIIDVGEGDGLHYIAMEYVRGVTVAERLKKDGPLRVRDAVHVAVQIAGALGAIHAKGFVHRDVKPSNILIDDELNAKLTDFGVAQLISQPDGERLTLAHAAVGTPQYMSPEQVLARVTLDGASDVYSLGMVLYETLAGHHPWEDTTSNEAMVKQVHEPLPPIRRYCHELPDDLEDLIHRCLEKDRKARPADGNALRKELQKILLRLDVGELAAGPAAEDYKSRVSGTGFYYVDTSRDGAPARLAGHRAVLREAWVQLTDPNKKARRELNLLGIRAMAARDDYKSSEARLEDLKKRKRYHDDKASGLREQAQKAISEAQSEAARAASTEESYHAQLALDYDHQIRDLGSQTEDLRATYDALKRQASRAADQLALQDAGARRAGKHVPVGQENPALSKKARLLTLGGFLVLALAGLVCLWLYVRVPSPAPIASAPRPPVAAPPEVTKKTEPPPPLIVESVKSPPTNTPLELVGVPPNLAVACGQVPPATAVKAKGGCANPLVDAMLGPSPYLSFSNSPFDGLKFTYFHLENFEHGGLNTPGVTASAGGISGPGASSDSVDDDDGIIDGKCPSGHSWYSQNRANLISFTFSKEILGDLPTHVGAVWTDVGAATPKDAYGDVVFEAYDANGLLIGTNGTSVGDGTGYSTTAEDRFFGAIHAGGISRIRFGMPNSTDWEMDHLQYGYAPGTTVPVTFRESVAAGSGLTLPRTGLVLHYSCDVDRGGVIPDESGNGNDGINTGPATVAKGLDSGALYFDGTDKVICKNFFASNLVTHRRGTFSFWFNKPTSTIRTVPMSKNGGSDSFVLWEDGSVFWEVDHLDIHSAAGTYTSNKWYHVAGVWNPDDTSRLYVNGQQVTAGALGVFNLAVGANLELGPFNNQPRFSYKGLLEDVRIYDRELTAAEVAALYSVGPGTVPVSYQEQATSKCPAVVTRTWSATDGCGNRTSATQVITVDAARSR